MKRHGNLLSSLIIFLLISSKAMSQYAESDTSQYLRKHSGTGVAISSNGYIATNYHVVENAYAIKVKGVNGDFTKVLSAEVVINDQKNDLAALGRNVIEYFLNNSQHESGNKGVN